METKNILKNILMNVWHSFQSICKWLFWIIFCCIAFLQIMIFSKMLEDWQNGIEKVRMAIFIYVSIFICFIVSLFIKAKYWRYISAIITIFIFLYFSTIPNLSVYFSYFNDF